MYLYPIYIIFPKLRRQIQRFQLWFLLLLKVYIMTSYLTDQKFFIFPNIILTHYLSAHFHFTQFFFTHITFYQIYFARLTLMMLCGALGVPHFRKATFFGLFQNRGGRGVQPGSKSTHTASIHWNFSYFSIFRGGKL